MVALVLQPIKIPDSTSLRWSVKHVNSLEKNKWDEASLNSYTINLVAAQEWILFKQQSRWVNVVCNLSVVGFYFSGTCFM